MRPLNEYVHESTEKPIKGQVQRPRPSLQIINELFRNRSNIIEQTRQYLFGNIKRLHFFKTIGILEGRIV